MNPLKIYLHPTRPGLSPVSLRLTDSLVFMAILFIYLWVMRFFGTLLPVQSGTTLVQSALVPAQTGGYSVLGPDSSALEPHWAGVIYFWSGTGLHFSARHSTHHMPAADQLSDK